MNINTTSQYMDKQIMDLSNSQSSAAANNNSGGSNTDFIDFMNRPAEKKEEIVPSYDFMPIRPAVGSSSPKAGRSANFDSDNEDAPLRTWNSLDSKTNSSPIINNSSVGPDKPWRKNHYGNLVSDIERMMKKHMDNLVHTIDNMSSRLSQLETRTRNLEHSIDDLKVSVGNIHGTVDGKMRLLENILNEVQSGVKVIRDKQEIVEAQLQIAKLQVPKVEPVKSKISAPPDSAQTTHQQFSGVSPPQPPLAVPPPNAPPTPQQQNFPPQVQLPNQFPQSQIPSVPQRDSYFPPPTQNPENQNQLYQLPPPQQPQQSAPPPPQQPQHSAPPPPQQPQHSAPPPPQHQYQPPSQPQYSQPPPPPQLHSSFSPVNPSLPQSPMGHHPDETLHMPPQTYPVGARPSPSHPPTGGPPPPSQQYYGPPPPNVYDPPPSRPGSGYSGSFGPSPGHAEPYPYSSSPSQYGSSSPVKPQQHSSSGMGQSGGSGYPQLPTARILPQALPTASTVGGGGSSPGSGGSGNRVPIDDVVDRVTNMGFPRDQVRATVRKLTENGQAVDLNIVLDKLMNDGDGQAPRGWFGR